MNESVSAKSASSFGRVLTFSSELPMLVKLIECNYLKIRDLCLNTASNQWFDEIENALAAPTSTAVAMFWSGQGTIESMILGILNILLARSCSPEDLFAAQARLLRVRNASIDAVAELSNRTRQLPSAPGVCLISANLNFWDGCLPQRGGRTQPGVLTPGKRTPQRSAL